MKASNFSDGIPHTCIFCNNRHSCPADDWYNGGENCKHYIVAKCFNCTHNGEGNEELCKAEDMSGYACNNFMLAEGCHADSD